MDRSQHYVTAMLDRIATSGLSDAGHQETFGKIKEVLTQTEDFRNQLKTLYKVPNFSEFALGLMWISDKVERDPSKLDLSVEEEGLVLELLKKAFGEVADVQEAAVPSPAEDPFGFAPSTDAVPAPTDTSAQTPTAEPPSAAPITAEPDAGSPAAAVAGVGGGGDEPGFAATLEKLVEAIQSGSEDRGRLLEELTARAERVVASPDSGDDFKAFCGYMMEFLKYASANQLFDDIRVMNMMSNAYDPFSQWAKTEPAARAGMLDQPNEVLRDFKTLFE